MIHACQGTSDRSGVPAIQRRIAIFQSLVGLKNEEKQKSEFFLFVYE